MAKLTPTAPKVRFSNHLSNPASACGVGSFDGRAETKPPRRKGLAPGRSFRTPSTLGQAPKSTKPSRNHDGKKGADARSKTAARSSAIESFSGPPVGRPEVRLRSSLRQTVVHRDETTPDNAPRQGKSYEGSRWGQGCRVKMTGFGGGLSERRRGGTFAFIAS